VWWVERGYTGQGALDVGSEIGTGRMRGLGHRPDNDIGPSRETVE
jgi:hypothetical protein